MIMSPGAFEVDLLEYEVWEICDVFVESTPEILKSICGVIIVQPLHMMTNLKNFLTAIQHGYTLSDCTAEGLKAVIYLQTDLR